MGWIDHIKEEWAVLKSAPAAFGLLVLFGLGAGFAGGAAFKSQEVANLESLMRLKDAELAAVKEKADAVPELTERVKALEEKLFSDALATDLATKGIIFYGRKWGAIGDDPGFLKALTASGWKADLQRDPPEYAEFLKAGPVFLPDSDQSYMTIVEAMKAADVPFSEKVGVDGKKVLVWQISDWQRAALERAPQSP